MLGLTQQERRVIQFLLISLLVGLTVTLYKRSHFGSDWQNSIIYENEFEKLQRLSKATNDSALVAKDKTLIAKSLAQFGAKININIATSEELESLPGIGPSLAKRIIKYREQRGQFASIDELKDVKGIGEKKYQKIRNMISVQ